MMRRCDDAPSPPIGQGPTRPIDTQSHCHHHHSSCTVREWPQFQKIPGNPGFGITRAHRGNRRGAASIGFRGGEGARCTRHTHREATPRASHRAWAAYVIVRSIGFVQERERLGVHFVHGCATFVFVHGCTTLHLIFAPNSKFGFLALTVVF